MRICLFTHTFPRFEGDSAAPFMDGVARSLCQDGNKLFVLTPYSPLIKKTTQPYHLITYKYIFPDSLHLLGYAKTLSDDKKIPFVNLLISPFLYFFGFIALMRLIKREKIDFISAHWILPNGFIAGLASFVTKVPLVSTLPGSDVYLASKNIIFKLMARFAAKISKAVTSNSPQLLADLKKLGAVSKNFSTIIYGVDPQRFYPDDRKGQLLRKRLGITEDKIIILGVGRLVAKKGFKYLVEAAPWILQKNQQVVFVIVGDGDQKISIEDLISKYNLQQYFYLVGNISYKDLPDYYNVADIFILPSIRDEQGNLDDQSVSVIEAMSSGLPVVTTNFPGYQVVIKNEINGFLIPPKDISQITQVLNRLIQDKNLRKKIGQQARIDVLTDSSWQAIGKEYLKLFDDILDKTKYYSSSVAGILESSGRQNKAKQIIGVLKQYLANTNSLSCLDIGCSNGIITNELIKHFKLVEGVDIDRVAIEQAKSKYHKKNLKFSTMSALNLQFRENLFDVVILNQVYEFVPDQQKLVREVYRVLKRGGICLVGARNKFSIIEGQSGLPLLHFLPNNLSRTVASIFGREYYPPQYKSLCGLKKLFKKFEINNLTESILRHPRQYNFISLTAYQPVVKLMPEWMMKLLINFVPNYILVCKKI